MRIVNTKQGSKEWRTWRGKGLGASDAPAVMGDSPWTSRFELWLEKTGLGTRPPANEYQIAAMRRGNELEPVARSLFEKKMGKLFPSVSGEHSDYPFMRASLDGYNEELNAMLEIKAPNKIDHAKALAGKVPDKYVAQLQMQFLVSGSEKAFYVSYDGKDSLAVVEVVPDVVYLPRLQDELISFWNLVQTKTPPEVTREDAQKLVKMVVDNMDGLNTAVNTLRALLDVDKPKNKGSKNE